jgi:glucose/arabinose dehydrogenase
MRQKRQTLVLLSLAVTSSLYAGPIPNAPIQGQPAQSLTFVSGLVAPVGMAFEPGAPSRAYVVDQAGRIKIVENGAPLAGSFLDVTAQITPLTTNYDERGLLGFAFDPGFTNPASPGYQRVWTYLTQPRDTAPADYTVPMPVGANFNHQGVVSSFKIDPANPNQVLPASQNVILRWNHPQGNHNGGSLRFGPDGLMYLSVGDGGNANDVGNGHNPTLGNAQDTTNLLGSVLRLDVNGTNSPNGKYGIPASNPFAASSTNQKEIYAYGLRNPYSFHFSGNRLLLGDVGQNNIEEVNEIVLGGNYGWNDKEGTYLFNPASPNTVTPDVGSAVAIAGNFIEPLKQYDHDEGIAIVGGFLYNGTKFPALVGKYIFGDFASNFTQDATQLNTGRLFYADLADGQVDSIQEFTLPGGLKLGQFVKGLAEGPNGEIYVMSSLKLGPNADAASGMVFELVPEPSTLLLVPPLAIFLAARRRRACQAGPCGLGPLSRRITLNEVAGCRHS